MKFFRSKTIVSTLRGTKENAKKKATSNSFLAKPKVNKEDTDEVIAYALIQLSKNEKLV